MKKKGIAIVLSLALGMMSFQGCIGTFGLTGKVYSFNKSLGNKWVQELAFLVMVIVPVYGIAIFIDAVILNSLEFWTGSNPVTMQPGEKEVQYVKNEGKVYRIEATQNHFHIEQVDGPEKGATADLVYNPETATWLAGKGSELTKVAQFIDQANKVKVFKPSGEAVMVRADATADEVRHELGIVK